jgi:ABC-type sugar transport system ATPase subunit
VQQVGAPEEVWAAPRNRFVATFVGTPAMNILPARGPLTPVDAPAAAHELGVRPEHVSLGGRGEPATVTLVEPVGSEAYVHVRAADASLVARVPTEARPEPGDSLAVALDPAHLHFFDAAGDRIGAP